MKVVDSEAQKKENIFLDALEHKAKKLKQLTLGQAFNIGQLSRLTGTSLHQCQQTINTLGQYFFLANAGKQGGQLYTINTDPQWRIDQINKQKEIYRLKYLDDQQYFDEMIELITPKLTPSLIVTPNPSV